MADTILYLRDVVFTPSEHIALTLVAVDHSPGSAACTFDVVEDVGVFEFAENARASARMLQAGIYRAATDNAVEVKLLMAGRIKGHWRMADTKPQIRTLSFQLIGPMQDLAIT